MLVKTQFVKVACAPFIIITDFVTVAVESAGCTVMVLRESDPDVAEKREHESPPTTVANLKVICVKVTPAPVMLNVVDALGIDVTAFMLGDGVSKIEPGRTAMVPVDSSTVAASLGCDAEPMKLIV